MQKIKVFLSSRVNSALQNLDQKYTLSDLRKYLKQNLEKETFLSEEIMDVIINEDSFKGNFSKNAFDNCLATMRECNIIIILYNGEAGWDVGANGICHDEFLVAMNEFSGMTYALDLSNYFSLPKSGKAVATNTQFQKEVADSFRHMEMIQAGTVKLFQEKVLIQIKGYLLSAIEKSFLTKKQIDSASSTFGPTLNWSKLTYDERALAIKTKLKSSLASTQLFDNVIKDIHCVPDNMSVADARNRIGRPFLQEHTLLKGNKKNAGVIHFVAVYGNATEIQVKNLVGFPDLAVIKASFGYYLWEKTSHIQMFFITKCINPSAIGKGFDQLVQWLRSSRETDKIVSRAKARFSILKVIEQAQEVSNL